MKNNKKKGGAPRKATDQKQTEDLRCRVTASEKQLVDKFAQEAGYIRTSDYIRDCVFHSVRPKAIITEPSREFLQFSQSFFSNFNQLMHCLNLREPANTQMTFFVKNVSTLRDEVRSLREQIKGNIDNDTIIALALNKLTPESLENLIERVQRRHEFREIDMELSAEIMDDF